MHICVHVCVCVSVCLCLCVFNDEDVHSVYRPLLCMLCVPVVVNLDDIVGVRVDEEDVRYFGKSHIVVFLLNTGMIIGITESYTFGSSK